MVGRRELPYHTDSLEDHTQFLDFLTKHQQNPTHFFPFERQITLHLVLKNSTPLSLMKQYPAITTFVTNAELIVILIYM